jgi:hypothetical protein
VTVSTRRAASRSATVPSSHHGAVGGAHKGKRVLVLVADLDIRVNDEDGVTLRRLELDPSVDYQGRVRDIV